MGKIVNNNNKNKIPFLIFNINKLILLICLFLI